MSENMLPTLTTKDARHLALPDAVHQRQSILIESTEGVFESDFFNHLSGELGATVSYPLTVTASYAAIALDRLSNVLFLRPGMKVLRITARAIVALVEDVQVSRSKCQFVSHAVRQQSLVITGVLAITVLVTAPIPRPAIVWSALGNAIPEVAREFFVSEKSVGFHEGSISTHVQLSMKGFARGR